MLEFKEDSESTIPLAEFMYNNSYHYSVGISPYEVLYGK